MIEGKPLSIGVIGFGHWGPNYVRNFSLIKNTKVKAVCEVDAKRLKVLKDMFPQIVATKDCRDILNDDEIKCVVIATPARTHYDLIREALLAQKDVLAEKPLCDSSTKAKKLATLAEKQKRILAVGHVFRFNEGIQKAKEQIEKNIVGEVYYIDIKRTNLGPVRTDVNVVWDLAPHDISILYHVLGEWPHEVSANGVDIFDNGREDFAFISLRYPNNILCHLHVSWIEPKKIRQMVIVGKKKMIIWDDIATNPIEIHEKWLAKESFYRDFGEFQLIPKEGPIFIPRLSMSEPLKNLCEHFFECVTSRKKPLTDAEEGVKNTIVIEAINKSINLRGKPVAIKYS